MRKEKRRTNRRFVRAAEENRSGRFVSAEDIDFKCPAPCIACCFQGWEMVGDGDAIDQSVYGAKGGDRRIDRCLDRCRIGCIDHAAGTAEPFRERFDPRLGDVGNMYACALPDQQVGGDLSYAARRAEHQEFLARVHLGDRRLPDR